MKYAAAAAIALAALSASASIFETNDTQRANLETVAKWTAASPSGGFARRALRTSKDDGRVTILAEGCDVAQGCTIEFLIVGDLSDRDYESMFRSFAKPGDIAAALEWLGVPRGVNAGSSDYRLFPRGERVAVSVRQFGATNDMPVAALLVDKKAGAAPSWDGFVYCGSQDDPLAKDRSRLADNEAPNAIVSTYNDRQTVLDVPTMSPQHDVYERFVLGDSAFFKPFALYEITFTPIKRKDSLPRVRPMTLSIAPAGSNVAYSVSCGDARSDFTSAADLLAFFKKAVDDGFDPFVSVAFDDALTLGQARAHAAMLDRLAGAIRIEPPANGNIFPKCLLPDESNRVYSKRTVQPWEVHFSSATNTITLVKTNEDWSDKNSLDPILSRDEFKLASPAEVAAKVAEIGEGLPILFVYAPDSAPMSTFMPTVRLLVEKHPAVLVFHE